MGLNKMLTEEEAKKDNKKQKEIKNLQITKSTKDDGLSPEAMGTD